MKRMRAAVEIGKPADQIDDRAVRRRIERVDREVAALGVAPPVAAEVHLGTAAIGLDVIAQCRHFIRPACGDNRDGAMLDAGRHRLEAGRFGPPRRFPGQRRRRDVDVRHGLAEQTIAHCAAGHPRLLAILRKHEEQALQMLVRQPVRLAGDRYGLAHA